MRKLLAAFILAAAAVAVMGGAAQAGNYWDGWKPGKAKGPMPPCNVNVIALGGDDILQATVDTYCGIKPGNYVSYINPAAWDVYTKKGAKYPDGQTGVLVFKDIDAVFTTDHKGGQPVYDAKKISTGQSIASKEAGHPLNPQTCAKCHATFNGVCKGFVCGNRI